MDLPKIHYAADDEEEGEDEDDLSKDDHRGHDLQQSKKEDFISEDEDDDEESDLEGSSIADLEKKYIQSHWVTGVLPSEYKRIDLG